jgi:glutathione synthase
MEVATRANKFNTEFFKGRIQDEIVVSEISDKFEFDFDGKSFEKNRLESPHNFDVIWIRLPPPIDPDFLRYLDIFHNALIINDPKGIYETGSKAFLLNFPEICAPMRLCETLEDIIHYKEAFPIVLKPLRDYGGKGIVRIDGNQVWKGKEITTFEKFKEEYRLKPQKYLGVKFLKKVTQGDKRIVVISGHVIGSSLRIPPKDSWLCNASMGGISERTSIDEDETLIVKTVNDQLSDMGIVMYGIDTLMGDEGQRVLSEINTTSIGGLIQMSRESGKDLVQKSSDLLWEHILTKI